MAAPGNVIDLLRDLVRIPSINPHGNPGAGPECVGEGRLARHVAGFLSEIGADASLEEVLPGRPNVIGKFPADRPGKPRVLLAPHLDTVSVAGMTIDPFGGEVHDGRLFGRGACDTKGTMAAMLWALRELGPAVAALPCEVWFVGLMGEEAGQAGSRAFAAAHRADFALVGEPTRLGTVHAHKGATWLTLSTTGRASHASRPDAGENAIYKMLDALRFLRTVVAPEFRSVADPVLGAPTLNVGTIAGGSKANIVPDACRAEVDIRTVPALYDTGFPASLERRLREVVPDLGIEVWQARPLRTDPSHPAVQLLAQLGQGLVSAPWFCDAAAFAEAGIPAVAAGPGSIDQAHTRDEWVETAEIERGVAFYRRFLESYPATAV